MSTMKIFPHRLHSGKYRLIISLTAAFLLGATTLNALVLQLDFGPTVATGDALTNSPWHTVSKSTSDTTWNTITADIFSGLLWSDGTSATGITVDVGARTGATGTTISTSATVTSGALGTQVKTGIYAGTSVATDGIYYGSGSQSRSVGVQIGGLSAGTYDIYISGRNTSTNTSTTLTFYAGASAQGGDFDYSLNSYVSTSLTFSSGATSATTSWSDSNYIVLSVTLAAGDYLNIVSTGASNPGFLNSVQIVAIPEPSIAAFLTGLGALVVGIIISRRRS